MLLLVAVGNSARAADAGFVELFNAKDLTGWRTTGNWVVGKDNVVSLQPRPGESGWQRYGAYLMTERTYGDFSYRNVRIKELKQQP